MVKTLTKLLLNLILKITSSSSTVFIDPRVCIRRNNTSKFLGRKSNNVGELSLAGTICEHPGKS